MLTNGLTGTTDATVTTAPNTSDSQPTAPTAPPTQVHPTANLPATTIRPRSGDPLLTSK
jgi:hypothetical protein